MDNRYQIAHIIEPLVIKQNIIFIMVIIIILYLGNWTLSIEMAEIVTTQNHFIFNI